jgi:hypothetical protein
MDVDLSKIDHELCLVLERLTREQGPLEGGWLVARARRELRDARVDHDAIVSAVDSSTLLAWLPTGEVAHLGEVLDGAILTLRVRAGLAGRTDLWCSVSVQPLLNLAACAPIPLADGSGVVSRPDTGHEVLVGPPGWLPPVDRYEVIGLRLGGGRLSVERVDEASYPDLEEQQRVKELLVKHYRLERWFVGEDDLASRPAEVVRALAHARLEDPHLLCAPHPPLEELLHLALRKDEEHHFWRDFAAQVEGTSSFWVGGMPDALHHELSARARLYGMSFDQYVVAVLGQAAWRTPFAEDMGPWQDWDPSPPDQEAAPVVAISDPAR